MAGASGGRSSSATSIRADGRGSWRWRWPSSCGGRAPRPPRPRPRLRAIAAAVALDWVPLSGAAVVAVGPRVELGRGSVTGRAGAPAVSAGRTAGLLGGAALAGSLALRAGRAFQPFVELEAGLTLAE